jgi:hypothetical protein
MHERHPNLQLQAPIPLVYGFCQHFGMSLKAVLLLLAEPMEIFKAFFAVFVKRLQGGHPIYPEEMPHAVEAF